MLLTRREKNIMPEHNEHLGWWVIVPWRLGDVRQFTGWHMGCHDLFQAQGMRRRPMQAWSLALGVGQLPVIHTPWVVVWRAAWPRPCAQHNNESTHWRKVRSQMVEVGEFKVDGWTFRTKVQNIGGHTLDHSSFTSKRREWHVVHRMTRRGDMEESANVVR